MKLKVRINTPKGVFLEKEADLVNFRTVEGAMGVLPRRAPIITHLSIHELEVVDGESRTKVHVAGGFLYCDGSELVIVTTDARGESVP